MEFLSSVSPQFAFQEQPAQPTKNQRRLQLRHSLSNKLIPKIGSPDNEEEQIILQKTRRRSSSASSKASSANYISPFEEYESFGIYSEFTDDRSKPSTPVDDVLPDASPLRLGGSAASTMRKPGGKELRKASFYSEASTLVSDGFGDLMLLSSQSIVGPRFYESGSGSENGSSKRERKSSNNIASNKRRPTARGRIGMGNHNIYTTPPRDSMRDISDYPYLDMHPEDARKYIEHLEQQTQDLTTQLHNLTSPTSTSSNVAKLKRLTAENRALKDEIAEWENVFDDKVKEQSRSRIIANEMEARARVKGMEQTLEETRETVKILTADIDKLKVIIDEVAHERDQAEKEKREMELKVDVLSEMLRAREGESRPSSRCSGRAGRNNVRGRYSTGSFSGSVVAALREGARPLSISSSQFDDSEEEANSRRGSDASLSAVEDLRILRLAHVGYTDAPSPRTMSPVEEPGVIQPVKRVRSFKGGSSPQPLILPTTTGISSPTSPISHNASRPPSTHLASHPTSFYGAGVQANSSSTSIDSGRTPSVRSGIAPLGNTLFSELSMLDDMMSDVTSHRDDASEYSRLHSRVPSYASFARHHHRGPSLITSPIVVTPRVRSPTPVHSPLRSPVRSPILATANESPPVPTSTCQLPPTRDSIFSMLTCPPSGPFQIVAATLTRYRLGKILIAVGHGLKSPRVTLYKVRTKAREVVVKVLAGEDEVEHVSKKRKKIWNQRGTGWNDDRSCSRCSRDNKKLGKSPRRSVSAPISTQASNPLLSSDTSTEGRSREPSVTRDQPELTNSLQNHRRQRISSTSKVGGKTSPQQGPEQVHRQHRVHAGDNLWLWFRFLMTIVVTLSVAVKGDEKKDNGQKLESLYRNDTTITEDEDANSDYQSEYDEDILQNKMNKWRRSRVSEVGSSETGFFEYLGGVLGILSMGGVRSSQ